MANNSQSVGQNVAPNLLQLKGGYKTEFYAAIGGGAITVTAADLIAQAVTDGVLMSGYKKLDGSLVQVAADGTEFVYHTDIDLKPINGGADALGDAIVASSADAVVTDVAGGTQNMDGGGSRTFGAREAGAGDFEVPANFAQVEIAEGSIIEVTISLARPPVNEATL